jgi:rhamnogalacturonan endolyase
MALVKIMQKTWLVRVLVAVGLAATAMVGLAAETLRFEAEDCVENRDAMLRDKAAPNRWMLWSTDHNAQKKWSGGVVLKSPEVKADRATPEEGAPPLHLVLKGIPKGTYDLRLKRGRALAVSMDGKEWRRLEGDVVARDLKIDQGTYEFWVDDRFAEIKPEARGASYIDCIYLEPSVLLVKGVWNGDFEMLVDGTPATWSWPAATENVAVSMVEGKGHSGTRALQFTAHPGEKMRWEANCRKPIPVGEEKSLCVSAWVKGTIASAGSITVDGTSNGQLVKRLIGQAVLEDAADWSRFSGYFQVPEGVTELSLSIRGSGPAELLVDDVTIEPGVAPVHKGTKVQGWATERVKEKLNRGVVALRTPQGAYVGWRLLESDPPTAAFTVLRIVDGGKPTAVQGSPISKTCDVVDRDVPKDGVVVYRVVPEGGVKPEGEASLAPAVEGTPHLKIRLKDADQVANRVAVADLDGDGAMDFVVKHPNQSIDPAGMYWHPSKDTYKLDAYTSGGEFLWRRDLGWSIETGVWYSPYIVCDLDGDGKAEVITKTGEGDPRDADGRVTTGPEWLTVIDGLTGKDVCRVAWPSRKGFAEYSRISRNQLAVAYLDGKTPCLLALRGTYCRMKVDAYMLVGRELKKVWSYDNASYPTVYWGQGAHTTRVADVDGDGRDEILLGSACIDDDGTPLWSTGRGHPDGCHVGHFLFGRPGLQVFYCVETAQTLKGGLAMVDAATGKDIWALAGPTRHVHSGGMCSDLDPTLPGCECYGADTDETKRSNRGWLYAADGTLLGTGLRYGSTHPTIYWDADLQREVFRSRIFDHDGGPLEAQVPTGKVVDILGDWREEVISASPGELRIYSTTLPAMDRRVCLLQDPIYRAGVCMSSMGYETPSTLSTPPAATAVNLNLTCMPNDGHPVCRVVVSTPPAVGLSGTVVLQAEGPFKLAADQLSVNVKPGDIFVQNVELRDLPEGKAVQGRVLAELKTGDESLRGEVWVELSARPSPGNAMVEAEAFSSEEGGHALVRAVKVCSGEKAVAQNDKGDCLEWSIDMSASGRCPLLMRYHATDKVTRRLLVNGVEVGMITFLPTRGLGDKREDWDDVTFVNSEGKPFTLKRGRQTVRLENVDGHALDLDCLGFSR